jgi:tRNA nucleotidyltransferase (CCA-adding enzyme)
VTINLPKNVEFILKNLEACGFEAFVVGGCVRDSFLHQEPHDWDICTDATPEQTKTSFNTYRVIETGIQHGTITIVIDEETYEITTYRIDGEYSDNRRPDLKADLARRDFTINAMAYNHKIGLVDFFGGQDDLQNKLIKCVGNPEDRFKEDALRILRAIRFASVYGFQIEENTKLSIHSLKKSLANIAVERINVELCKLLCGIGVECVLNNRTGSEKSSSYV